MAANPAKRYRFSLNSCSAIDTVRAAFPSDVARLYTNGTSSALYINGLGWHNYRAAPRAL